METIPTTKPPTCAHQATPPPASAGTAAAAVPLKSWIRNHEPNTNEAGNSNTKGMNRTGRNVAIRARGKHTRYAPRTPAIAPLAPIIGTGETGSMATWNEVAATPHPM